MLKKNICKTCHEKHGEAWTNWKEEEWKKGWEVTPEKIRNDVKLAETEIQKQHVERLLKVAARSSSSIDDAPPAWCPYVLNHMFSSSEA